MPRTQLRDDVKALKHAIAGSERIVDLTLDDNVVSFSISTAPLSISAEKWVKFEIFYQDADTYPAGGGILTVEESDGFEGVIEEANLLMESDSQLSSLIRLLCEHLKISLPGFDHSPVPKRGDSDNITPMSRNISQSSVGSCYSEPDTWGMPPCGFATVGVTGLNDARLRVRADLDEVHRHGYGGGLLDSAFFLPVWLSIDVARLHLHPETAAAWRLDPAATILVSTRFTTTYPSAASADDLDAAAAGGGGRFHARAVWPDARGRWWETHGAGPDADSGGGGGEGDGGGDGGGGFGLQWTLNDRLKGFLRILAVQASPHPPNPHRPLIPLHLCPAYPALPPTSPHPGS